MNQIGIKTMHARLFSSKNFRNGLQFSLSVGIGIAAGLAVGALEKANDANALWDWDWVTVSDITTAVVSVAMHNLIRYSMRRCCPLDPQRELEIQPFRRYSANFV